MAVERFKITEAFAESLQSRVKVFNVYDSEVTNLFIRVQVSGSKAYYVKHNKNMRKLGDVGVMTIKQARDSARKSLVNGIEEVARLSKTLGQAFDEYQSHKKLSKGFISNLNQAKRIFQSYLSLPLSGLSKQAVAHTIKTTRKLNGEPYADSTLDSVINVLSSVYSLQIALEVTGDNPCRFIRKGLRKLQINKRDFRLETPEEFSMLYDWYCQYDDVDFRKLPTGLSIANIKDFKLTRLAVVFMLLTGCRVSEAVNLRKGDVNYEYRRGFIDLTFRETKNGRDHTLLMPKHLYLVVEQAKGLTTSDYIFRQPNQKEGAAYSVIERSLAKLVIRGKAVRPHDLRRTCAYQASLAGLTEAQVAVILNHSKGSITERYIGERTEQTFEILSKYHDRLNGLVYTDRDGYRHYGLSLFTNSKSAPLHIVPLKEIEHKEHVNNLQIEDYYS